MRGLGPSLHLSWAELDCHDGTPYPQQWAARAKALSVEFETLRLLCHNAPLVVLSGYRTPAHNKAVGGARNSQHLFGMAMDLRPPADMSVGAFHALILQYAATPISRIGGIGRYPTFVHVDIRVGTRLARWSGGSGDA